MSEPQLRSLEHRSEEQYSKLTKSAVITQIKEELSRSKIQDGPTITDKQKRTAALKAMLLTPAINQKKHGPQQVEEPETEGKYSKVMAWGTPRLVMR